MHKEKYPYSTGRLREPIERARCAGSRLRKEQEIMAGKKQIHAGHRQRMHDRVSQYGLESLAEHEVLEYLLYFTNAQRNTNPIAHALLEQFGDLAGVLEATEAELCQVEGVGPASARLLHLLPQVCACYNRSRTNDRRKLQTVEQMGSYMMNRFRGLNKERVLLVCLDKNRRITNTSWLNAGKDDQVDLPVQEAIAQAVRMRACNVLICHNHPNGNVLPSRQDIEATAELARGMHLVGVRLLDHIIVTENEFISLRQRNEMSDPGGIKLDLFAPREV